MYEFSSSGLFRRLLRIAYWGAHLPLAFAVLWVIGLAFCQPLCAVAFIPFIGIVIWRLKQTTHFHLRTWIAFFCLCEALIFFSLPGPQPDTWQQSTARPTVISKIGDGRLRIAPIRDFIYRTEDDFDVRYLEEEFNPNDIAGVYLAECVNKQDSLDSELMLSFAFKDGNYLVISPEIRIPAGEEENSLRKYYKNYGLIYVFGTEEDIFALRTNVQHRYLSLYPLKADAAQAQEMFARCLSLAQQTQAENRCYHPLQQAYRNDLLDVLRPICPALPEMAPIHNGNVAKLLYRNGALNIPAQGDWSHVRRQYAVGFDISPAEREAYSDTIRTRTGLAVRYTRPERHEEQRLSDKLPTIPNIPKSVAPTLTSAADIPEPGDRLAADTRRRTPETPPAPVATEQPAAEQQTPQQTAEATPEEATADKDAVLRQEDTESVAAATRELDKNEQLLGTARPASAADAIPEPGARLRADMLKEEAAEEEAIQEAKRHGESMGRLIGDEKDPNKATENFNNAFFGGRSSGVRTIRKSQEQQENPHPLDPVRKNKRKNPFNDEAEAPQEKQDDPFAPKAPIKI